MARDEEVFASGPGWGLVCDPALVDRPDPDLLVPDAWTEHIVGRAGAGRGGVVFVAAGDQQWALRHYHRGGLFGRLVRDHYLFTGAGRTRGFREWTMLAALAAGGLPVPRPVAASYRREGLVYTADLATVRIPGAEPLSARLRVPGAGEPPWVEIGATIRRFHDAGAFHADLNAHNILLDGAGCWLIDFDRGRFRRPGPWRQANLARLERSLRKIAAEPRARPFSAVGWQDLLAGYAG
jgi:3-deoxy-D-manno-octulosonic acid kinase